jgi:flagellum-specific peptidoglycan hydrolase FlgJ
MKLKTFLLTGLLSFGTMTIKAQEMQILPFTQIQNDVLTKRGLYKQIIKYGIKFPDIVFAQALLESGEFTSGLFKSANNLFGMKVPDTRESARIGETKSGYSKYEDWYFSVYDYSLWQNFMLKNKGDLTKNQYLAFLGKIYASDKRYVSNIKRVIGEHQHILMD